MLSLITYLGKVNYSGSGIKPEPEILKYITVYTSNSLNSPSVFVKIYITSIPIRV
jgi:hypothetical protein